LVHVYDVVGPQTAVVPAVPPKVPPLQLATAPNVLAGIVFPCVAIAAVVPVASEMQTGVTITKVPVTVFPTAIN
jgi:hypothetical protein